MKILLQPQVNSDGKKIIYTFEGEVITASLDGASDEFDFTGFPDGEISGNDIETTLPLIVIVKAEKENGVLSVELLNFISEDAPYEERFPEWMDV
jgi:hypothetical protein